MLRSDADMFTLSYICPKSAAKMAALSVFVLVAIGIVLIGAIETLESLVFRGSIPSQNIPIAIGIAIMAPFFYALAAAICTACVAFAYNYLARTSGGIRVRLSD